MPFPGRTSGPRVGQDLLGGTTAAESAGSDLVHTSTRRGRSIQQVSSPSPSEELVLYTPPREAPSGAVIPRKGLPAVRYQLNKLRGHPELVPPLSRREQELHMKQLAAEELIRKRAARKAFIYNASNKWGAMDGDNLIEWNAFGCVIGLFNQKGGAAKTTDSALIGDYLAANADGDVLIMPVAGNSGSTGDKSGADNLNTKSLEQAEKILLELTKDKTVKASATEFKSKLKKNDFGAFVISQVELPNDFGGARLRWVLEQLKEMFQYIILDTGNEPARTGGKDQGLPEGGNVIYEAARQSDVIIFACNPKVPDSPMLMGGSMDSLTVIKEPDKLLRSIVVVNGHELGNVADVKKWVTCAQSKVNLKYQEYGPRDFPYRVINQGDSVPKLGELILFPVDKHLAESPMVMLDMISDDVLAALERLVYEAIVRAGQTKNEDFQGLKKVLELQDAALQHATFEGMSAPDLQTALAQLEANL